MEMNTFVGMLIGGLASILGLFALIYDRLFKPRFELEKEMIHKQSQRQIEQIRVQEKTNSELSKLNDKIDNILKDYEKQGKKINELELKYSDHEVRIRTIESTRYEKLRVDC